MERGPLPVLLRAVRSAALAALAALAGAQPVESPGRFGFHLFPAGPGQDLGLASRPVSDRRGGFWFFLPPAGIWRFDARGYRPLGAADGMPKEPVDKAFPEPSSGLWFVAGGALHHLGPEGVRRVADLPTSGGDPNLLPIRNEGFAWVEGNRLRVFRPDRPPLDLAAPGAGVWVKGWKDPKGEERLLVGDQGLARWDGQAWTLRPLAGLLQGRGWDVFRVASGALWVRSDRDLARVEPAPTRFGPRLGFTRNSYVTMEEDAFGRVWTNGPEGLACVEGDRVWRIGEKEGLSGYQGYWPIAFDAQGTLWTISDSGFLQLKGAFLWSVQDQAFGLPRAMVFRIQRSRDGRLYAGTHDGLFRRTGARWEIVPGTEGWATFVIAERANGEIWGAGNPPGPHDLPLFRQPPGRPATRPEIAGMATGTWATALAWGADGALWCGTTKGLYRIRAAGAGFAAERATLPGRSPEASINSLDLTPDGTLWAGLDDGLFRLRGAEWTRFGKAEGLAADDITGIFQGPRGEWWVLHDGSRAITRLAFAPSRGWTVAGAFGPDHPLTHLGAKAGWTDARGVVWLLSGRDVVRWDSLQAEHHSKGFGVPIDDFFENGILGEPDGRLWIGSISGLVCFDPRFYRPIPPPPALVPGQSLDGGGRPFGAGAELPFRKAGVSFELGLPLVEGLEDLRVQTRLVGLDDAWQALEGSHLRLPGLPPGRYLLEARAARRDGLNGPTLAFPFRILPPWYLRSATLAAAVLALAAGAWLLLRWRTWALRRERRRLARLVEQRTSDLVQANDALTHALAEVRTLKGLVPICSYCKRIRSDEGFWRQLEQVLAEQTEARFSHGICPDCAPKVRAAWEAEQEEDGVLPEPPPAWTRDHRPGAAG